ncbi:hypothetical protein AKJ57_01925 [candidate division MSBL1 archaeon SCGC-AAA259A05]|uniref:Uncharacterized protein n=1 Tax=candidate division MSBL1 archaeon SCGC-AAA259A05 TaxID=1698259 RepID=A0A133UAP0_9EURY|nr:hypothetical protein AKJ57_01925 [candidate division MSBL1 archaeon SCGC-AAA259A05]
MLFLFKTRKDVIIMDERAQGATEFLLMLAVALAIVVAVVGLTMGTFDELGSSIREQVSRTEDNLIQDLT